MTNNSNDVRDAFGRLIQAMSRTLNKPTWFEILEEEDSVEKGIITLRQQTNLDPNNYVDMLKACNLIGSRSDGKPTILKKPFEKFFDQFALGMGYEFITKFIIDKKRWVVRLGSVQSGDRGYADAKKQMEAGVKCPRLPELTDLRSELQHTLHQNNSIVPSNSDVLLSCPDENPATESINLCDSKPSHNDSQQHATSPSLANIDLTSMSDSQLKTLQNMVAQEQMKRATSEESPVCTFDMYNWNTPYTCIPVPKLHKDTRAFERYQWKKPYVKEFCSAVGGGDLNAGVERVLSYLAPRHEELYTECGKNKGLVMSDRMDADALAGMAIDCNLKQWQLKKVLKHVKFATGCPLSSVTMKELSAKFASDMVIPETGKYRYDTINDKGTPITEVVTYDYQSLVDVFKYVTAQLLMEKDGSAKRVKKVCIVLGGDHGIGAFRLTVRILIELDDGEVLKDEIGISTVFCKKDSSDVLKNTILERLTADMRLITESFLQFTEDDEGFVECELRRRDSDNSSAINGSISMEKAIYIAGDLKWLSMLLGMEDMSTYWCILCLLGKAGFAPSNHSKGEKRTIEMIRALIEMYGIEECDGTDPKHLGVKSNPFWDFIPVENFVIPLLHVWMGVFNDIDEWFLKKVDGFVWKSEAEKAMLSSIDSLDEQYTEARAKVEVFKKDSEGKRRSKLMTRKNKHRTPSMSALTDHSKYPPLNEAEEAEFVKLDSTWKKITAARDVLKAKKSDAAKELLEYHSELKKSNKSVYAAIDKHWEDNGKSRAAYHGGKWTGKDARDGMSNPEQYYGVMRQTLLDWRADGKTEDDVNVPLDDVIDLLKKWHEVFHLLRAKKRSSVSEVILKQAIINAIKKHREVGLSITPKVHLIEDHVLEQFFNLPFAFFYFIEEFVEHNHQIGHKYEEQVKRIKNDDVRATSKARQIWISRNRKVQRYINKVRQHGMRGPYKKTTTAETGVTPPVYPRPRPLVTAELEKVRAAAGDVDVEAQQMSSITAASDYTPPPQKRQRTEGGSHLTND